MKEDANENPHDEATAEVDGDEQVSDPAALQFKLKEPAFDVFRYLFHDLETYT
jgi:hypothetical protein